MCVCLCAFLISMQSSDLQSVPATMPNKWQTYCSFYYPPILAFCLLCGCDIMSELLSLGDVTKQHLTALFFFLNFPPLFSSSSILSDLLQLHFCFTTPDTHPSPPSARHRVSPLCCPSFRQPPFCVCQSLTAIEESWKYEGDKCV